MVWGARGRWFESSHPDIKKVLQVFVEPFLFIFNTYFNTSSSKVVSERGKIIKSATWYTRRISPRFFVATLLWITSGSKNFSRIKNRCHTCQIPINNLIFSRFLWQVEPFFIVMACHALLWQRMTSDFASTCHRKSLSIKMFSIHWQVWQGFLNLTSPNICHPCNKPLNHQQIRR